MCIEWHQAAQKFQWDTSTALPATSGVREEFVEGGLFWEEAWCPSHSIILWSEPGPGGWVGWRGHRGIASNPGVKGLFSSDSKQISMLQQTNFNLYTRSPFPTPPSTPSWCSRWGDDDWWVLPKSVVTLCTAFNVWGPLTPVN